MGYSPASQTGVWMARRVKKTTAHPLDNGPMRALSGGNISSVTCNSGSWCCPRLTASFLEESRQTCHHVHQRETAETNPSKGEALTPFFIAKLLATTGVRPTGPALF